FGADAPPTDFVAHEWGTFTSVQGADGIQMEWNPRIKTELPAFVYDRAKPTGNPRLSVVNSFGKGWIRAIQRMETPVIYFYGDKERTVDVTVKFPQGIVTEWYPQARDIGPSTVQARPLFGAVDNLASKAGLQNIVNLSSMDTKKGIPESLIRWAGIKILPTRSHGDLSSSVPMDKSGSHYYAARETDADLIQVSGDKTEREKFLFYRGVGNFAAPLRAVLGGGDGDYLYLHNNGNEDLAHLFVVNVRDGRGKFIHLERLASQADAPVQLDLNNNEMPLGEMTARISEQMRLALMKEGLYEREATAMVKTWRDSWMEEKGLRVLYVLPRAWTDRILP